MRNTLDLDFNDKEKVDAILHHIFTCPYAKGRFKQTTSASMNGVHIEFWCERNCDLCRFVFDDPFRYAADLTRPEYTRDVLWEKKSFFKMNTTLVLEK